VRDRLMSLVAIVLLSVVCAASYFYARSLQQQGAYVRPRPGSPDFYIEHFVVTQYDATGEPRRRVFADRMTHLAENDDVELDRPRLLSLRADQPMLEARALHARLEDTGEVLHMEGQVVVVRAADAHTPPLRVETERLTARPDDDRYTSDARVLVERGASTATADGMDLDNIARTLALDGTVRTLIAPRPDPAPATASLPSPPPVPAPAAR